MNACKRREREYDKWLDCKIRWRVVVIKKGGFFLFLLVDWDLVEATCVKMVQPKWQARNPNPMIVCGPKQFRGKSRISWQAVGRQSPYLKPCLLRSQNWYHEIYLFLSLRELSDLGWIRRLHVYLSTELYYGILLKVPDLQQVRTRMSMNEDLPREYSLRNPWLRLEVLLQSERRCHKSIPQCKSHRPCMSMPRKIQDLSSSASGIIHACPVHSTTKSHKPRTCGQESIYCATSLAAY